MNKKILLAVLLLIFFCISLAANGALVFSIAKFQNALAQHEVNRKILDFRNMFTEDVLLSDRPIDFDTRMALETSVRSLNDQEVFTQWQKFTNSQTKEDATAQAKNLLKLLIQRTTD